MFFMYKRFHFLIFVGVIIHRICIVEEILVNCPYSTKVWRENTSADLELQEN